MGSIMGKEGSKRNAPYVEAGMNWRLRARCSLNLGTPAMSVGAVRSNSRDGVSRMQEARGGMQLQPLGGRHCVDEDWAAPGRPARHTPVAGPRLCSMRNCRSARGRLATRQGCGNDAAMDRQSRRRRPGRRDASKLPFSCVRYWPGPPVPGSTQRRAQRLQCRERQIRPAAAFTAPPIAELP